MASLLHSEEFINDEGLRVVKEVYGYIKDGEEVITATIEETYAPEIEAEKTTTISPEPTNAEIYANQLIIMEALADLYAGGATNG